MGVYKLSANSVKNGRTIYGSMLAGNTAYANGDFNSIATSIVGAGGATSITFNSIPSTYTHLQLRCITSGTRADYQISEFNVQFNGDGGTNYSAHDFYGQGSASTSNTTSRTNQTSIILAPGTQGANAGSPSGGRFGAAVIDIFDYASTVKNKTFRAISGVDLNGTYNSLGGRVGMTSGIWRNNTNAVSSITITPQLSPFVQYTKFALYGIRQAV